MPKYWENYADLSRDSSAESALDSEDSSQFEGVVQNTDDRTPIQSPRPSTSRHRSATSQAESIEEVNRTADVDGTVSKLLAKDSQLPALEPHQHASLFYLSLIEGRCRTQAVSSINSGRSASDFVTEESPEVDVLAEHLFAEMSKELVKAGMIPEEFAHRPLPELRLYLKSFDSILQGLVTPLQDISMAKNYKVIEDGSENAAVFETSLSTATAPAAEAANWRTARDALEFHNPQPEGNVHTSLGGDSRGQTSIVTRRSSINPPLHTFSDIFERSGSLAYKQDLQNSRGSQLSDGMLTGDNDNGSTSADSSSFNPFAASRALVPQNQSRLIIPRALLGQQIPFTLTDPRYPEPSIPKSVFATEYTTTAILGKGGFGKVLKVRSHLDMAEYAVKRIKYPAAKVRQLAETGQMQELLNEVQALARYNHQHVVRYYHAWIETQPNLTTPHDVWSENHHQHSQQIVDLSRSNKPDSSVLGSVVTDLENIALEDRQALDNVLHLQRENDAAFELNKDHVIFEREPSQPRNGPRSFFRSVLEPESPSDSDEDDTSAPAGTSDAGTSSTISLSRQQTNETALPLSGNRSIIPLPTDCYIYIKMAPYPLTLADFLYPSIDGNILGNTQAPCFHHCFHSLSTIRLFLRILSGLAYLHRKQQIHRDLKPANIFLSILEDGEPPDNAWVDVNDCRECLMGGQSRSPCYMSPCIGDFGLVVDLKALEDEVPAPILSASNQNAVSPDAHVKTPGTKLYIPPNQSTHNIICPKIDTYALGIILLELTHRFDTKSERMIVLERARQGDWPSNFDEHDMARGIKGMMELDREKRWSCEGIRMWAENLETALLDRAVIISDAESNPVIL